MNRTPIDRFQLMSWFLALLGLMVGLFALSLFMFGGGRFPALDVHAMTNAVLCFTSGVVLLVLIIFVFVDVLSEKTWRIPALMMLGFVGGALTLIGYGLMFLAGGFLG